MGYPALANNQQDTGSAATRLTVRDALPGDVDRGVVRIDPVDFARFEIAIGDFVALLGPSDGAVVTMTHARVMPAYPVDRGLQAIQIDEVQRSNMGVALNSTISLQKVMATPCARVVLEPADDATRQQVAAQAALGARILPLLETVPLTAGDLLRIPHAGSARLAFNVRATEPAGAVFGASVTRIVIEDQSPTTVQSEMPLADDNPSPVPVSAGDPPQAERVSSPEPVSTPQADQAVLVTPTMTDVPWRRVLRDLSQTIVHTVTNPDRAAQIGLSSVRGALVTGPAASGKTVLAQALVDLEGVHCVFVNGYDLIARGPDGAAALIRAAFDTVKAHVPGLLILDDLHALFSAGPSFDSIETRTIALLARQIDGLQEMPGTAVIGLARDDRSVPAPLTQNGRFDLRFSIDTSGASGCLTHLAALLEDIPGSNAINPAAFTSDIASLTVAQLTTAVRDASLMALRSAMESQEPPILTADALSGAFQNMRDGGNP